MNNLVNNLLLVTYPIDNSTFLVHSWFTTVVDFTEFSPVKPILMKPFKYEDHEDEGAMGATIASMKDFGINIHIRFKDFKLHVRSSLRQGVPG